MEKVVRVVRGKPANNQTANRQLTNKPPENKLPQKQVKQIRKPIQKPKSRTKVGVERLAKFDIPFFIITLVLMVFGIGMLLSASFAFAAREHNGDNYFFFNNQLRFMLAGLFVMLVLSRLPYRFFLDKRVVFAIAGVSAAMMIATNLGVGGVEQGGATRWLEIGPITFQPSEFLKFAMIVVLAYFAHTHHELLKRFRAGFIPFISIAGFACFLMAWQRHLSGLIIMFAIAATLIVVSPAKLKHVIVITLLLAVLAALALPVIDNISDANVAGRMESWRNPESDIQGETFQTYQSLVTIGSGGWFGLGLGNSRQKFQYLPAIHNDFIYSVVCEELGFVGGALVLLLFVILVLRGFYIASHARDRFGMMLAVGITAQIGIQAFLNIAVATNSVPNTGISLPFFSYGGTAMLVMLAQIGILLNISRKASIE